MKKILFPTDFSNAANNAFLYALHLAKSMNAELFILHTYERPIISSLHEGRPEIVEDVYTNIELSEFDHFKEEVAQMHQIAEDFNLQNIQMKFLFEKGELQHIISNIIRKEHIDLIAMGTNGTSGYNKKFWGKNTLNTMKSVKIPVLGIPQNAKFHPIKTIGFTTLFHELDRNLVEELLKQVEFFDGKVKCLHILEYGGNMDTKIKFAKESVKAWREYFNDNPRLEFVIVESESVKKTVLDFATREHIDILAIVKRKITLYESIFYPSLTDNLAKSVAVPMLVVKDVEHRPVEN